MGYKTQIEIEKIKKRILKKYQPIKNADLEKVVDEIELVATLVVNPMNAERGRYKIHNVPVDNVEYIAADAKYLGKHTNQNGRGNLRLLYEHKTHGFAGLALESDSGQYTMVGRY